MHESNSTHHAHYDAFGNIIVDPDAPRLSRATDHPKDEPSTEPDAGKNELPEGPYIERLLLVSAASVNPKPSFVMELKDRTRSLLWNAVDEGKKQYEATAEDTRTELEEATLSLRELPGRIRAILKSTWTTMTTPVSFRKSKRPKTRLTLFFVDTVRFGGTFAAIFAVLFAAINYQSFLQIAKAQLALGDDLKTEQALEHMVQGTADADSPAQTAIRSHFLGSLIAYLPEVGPYEDRIVIPKLGKNVPIVRPGMDALMKEDWAQFEHDIQDALKGGVVHYPGSARPGQAGNFFLTGHSSYYPWDDGKYKDVFARLGELVPGDTYSVYYGGDKHVYRITEKKEVKPSNVSVLDQPTDKRLATLMTCTPVGTTLRRLILVAEEIDPSTGLALKVGESIAEPKALPFSRLNALPI